MALYCLKCSKELSLVVMMQAHVVNCWGDAKDQGQFAGQWDKAAVSPMLMSQLYFTTTNPKTANLRFPETRDVIFDGLFHAAVRPSVQEALKAILNNEAKLQDFDHKNFRNRLAISATVADDKVYYRKMAQGEWAASSAAWSQATKANPFAAAFTYTRTDNYRYWVSSSLAKVRAFGNENSSDNAGVIVKITFSQSPLTKFASAIKAHQQQGVQGDAAAVAIHREGFAEIGAIAKAEHVQEILTPNPKLDFNLGFTSSQSADLFSILTGFAQQN